MSSTSTQWVVISGDDWVVEIDSGPPEQRVEECVYRMLYNGRETIQILSGQQLKYAPIPTLPTHPLWKASEAGYAGNVWLRADDEYLVSGQILDLGVELHSALARCSQIEVLTESARQEQGAWLTRVGPAPRARISALATRSA